MRVYETSGETKKIHTFIKEVLLEIGNNKSICKTVSEAEREPNLGLYVRKGKKKDKEGMSTYFIPDVFFNRGKSKKGYAFQILKSQAKNRKEIFGDIFTALLSYEVSRLYFIFPIKKLKDIISIINVSRSLLRHKLGVEKSIIPISLIPIDYSNLEKQEPKFIKRKIRKSLIEKAKEEKW
jgi:hypothetical protein